jgi:hypothetical protein
MRTERFFGGIWIVLSYSRDDRFMLFDRVFNAVGIRQCGVAE